MKLSAYRSSPEAIVLDEPDWKIKYAYSAHERDKWQDRSFRLERELERAKRLLEDRADHTVCVSPGCVQERAECSRTGLCPGHLYEAHDDMIVWSLEYNGMPDPCRDIARKAREERTPIPPGRPWVVYYIRMGDRVKIGRTVNLARRMASFCAQPDQLLAVEPGVYVNGVDRELQRHREFASFRLNGTELFDLAPEIEAHIADIVETFGDPLTYL